MKQETILLTGATGFLGSHLLEAFLKKGYKVVILKRSTSNKWRINHLAGKYVSYNVDEQPLERAFSEQRIDYVVHTACHYGRNKDSISQVVETNLMLGIRLLDAAIRFNTNTFFNTDTLLQKYLNIYTLSKKQFVEWLKQQSERIQVVNLKLEHMYGAKDDTTKFVPWVLSQLKQNVDEINLTAGEQKRDFIHVDDVVSAYLITLQKSNKLEQFSEFDVGTGNLMTIKSFIVKIKEAYEKETDVSNVTSLNFGAIPYRKGEMMEVKVNIKPLINLGWKQNYKIDEGIADILKNYL